MCTFSWAGDHATPIPTITPLMVHIPGVFIAAAVPVVRQHQPDCDICFVTMTALTGLSFPYRDSVYSYTTLQLALLISCVRNYVTSELAGQQVHFIITYSKITLNPCIRVISHYLCTSSKWVYRPLDLYHFFCPSSFHRSTLIPFYQNGFNTVLGGWNMGTQVKQWPQSLRFYQGACALSSQDCLYTNQSQANVKH